MADEFADRAGDRRRRGGLGCLEAEPFREQLAAARVDGGALDAGPADVDAQDLDGPLLRRAVRTESRGRDSLTP